MTLTATIANYYKKRRNTQEELEIYVKSFAEVKSFRYLAVEDNQNEEETNITNKLQNGNRVHYAKQTANIYEPDRNNKYEDAQNITKANFHLYTAAARRDSEEKY